MKARKSRTEKEEKRLTRRLFLWMIISGLVCAGLLIGVLVYFFVPRDNDTYILTIPSLVGKNEGEVKSYSGLEITREWIYSSSTPKGRIISQMPYGGARRKIRSGEKYEVTIFVSLGDKTERIPDLSGVGVNSAAAALRAIHANIRSVPIYGGGEDGVVLYTSPSANSEIMAGDTVTMFVARQRVEGSIRVPDFIGMGLSEAYRVALSMGLFVDGDESSVLSDIVTRQSIPDGSMVRRGSYISFATSEAIEEKEREWPPVAEDTDKREDRE